MKTEKFFQEIYDICNQNRKEQEYNIFSVLEISRKEVFICRVLSDLINPEGNHGKGSKYLKTFLKDILNRDDADEICKDAFVFKEYLIKDNRRIDIVIRTKKVFIPIEVKIYAREQEAQCFEYIDFARKYDDSANVVYLTVHGHSPGSYSLCDRNDQNHLSEKDYILISFEHHILKWLEMHIQSEDDGKMRLILKQYAEAIESFSKYQNGNVRMKITEKILESEQNFRSMLAVSDVVNETKSKLIELVMSDIDLAISTKIQQKNLRLCKSEYNYYHFSDVSHSFYNQSDSSYPGIHFLFKDFRFSEYENYQLWLRVEIDYRLYFGICIFDMSAGQMSLKKDIFRVQSIFQMKQSEQKRLNSCRIRIKQYMYIAEAETEVSRLRKNWRNWGIQTLSNLEE